jgi:hypothetical protein
VVTAACSGRTPSRRIDGGKLAASGGWPAGQQLGQWRRKVRRDGGRARAREARGARPWLPGPDGLWWA